MTTIDKPQGNHPLAPRMCGIAFLSYNVSLGCMSGTFGVLIGAMEAKLGITRELSSLGVPMAMLGIALISPLAGVLAEKISIRLLMLAGALINLVAYVILAVSMNIYVDLAAYGLLIGPGLCFTATVLPSALVTRWYTVNRGRALGLITMPLVLAILSPVSAMTLGAYGLSATYGLLAALMGLLLLPMFFIVDYPPQAIDAAGEDATAAAHLGPTVGQLLRSGHFWALALAAAAITSGAVVFSTHLLPMVADWGIDANKGASLLAAGALAGMAGAVAFGWIADRLGGARTLALVCFNSAILWAIMLLHPSFIVILLVSALLGLHASAVVAVFGLALSQQFGQAGFGRALGLGFLIALPFNVAGVPIAARIYTSTGSYAGAVIGQVGVFVLGALLAASARVAKPISATT